MNGMASWELFEDLRDTQDELLRMNRMPAQRLNLFGHIHPGMSTPPWTPAVDISERKDGYLVAAELPGVGIDDLEITFEGGLLTIQGQRRAAARLLRGADTSGRTPLRRLPPLNHPAHPREAGGYRSLDSRRRAADHGAQGGGSTRQAHPGARRRWACDSWGRRRDPQLTTGRAVAFAERTSET